MEHTHTIRQTLIIAIFLISGPLLFAQTLWPGDVNDNGTVNTIDLLYCSLAKDAEGPSRPDATSDWEEQPLGEDWEQSFADGINFAYADCNGDGVSDDDDFDVLKDHYSFTHGTIEPDVYVLGNPENDPVLLISPTQESVEAGSSIKINVSLGDAEHPITNLYGIVFTLNFDPAITSEPSSNGNPQQNVKFKLKNGSWIAGSGSNKSAAFIKVDYQNGKADVAIIRKNIGITSGYGPIGDFIVVMEDVVFLEDGTMPFSLDKIKLIDPELNEYPVAPSQTEVLLASVEPVRRVLANTTEPTSSVELSESVVFYQSVDGKRAWLLTQELKNIANKVVVLDKDNTILFYQDSFKNQKQEKIDLSPFREQIHEIRIYTNTKFQSYLVPNASSN